MKISNETIFATIVLMCVIALTIVICRDNPDTTSPVEKNMIDSLQRVNDSLQSRISYLDSVKNEKVIEVYNLDNDSTIKLFYKLVKR